MINLEQIKACLNKRKRKIYINVSILLLYYYFLFQEIKSSSEIPREKYLRNHRQFLKLYIHNVFCSFLDQRFGLFFYCQRELISADERKGRLHCNPLKFEIQRY